MLLILTACAAQKGEKKDIDFIITNRVLTDSVIHFKVVNNSAVAYILPIMIFPEHEKINPIVPAGERSLFFVHTTIYNENDDLMQWYCYDCFPHHNTEEDRQLERLDNLWKERKKDLKLTDLVVLKPKETKIFEIIFRSEIEVTDNSIFRINGINSSDKYYVRLSYSGENTEYPASITPKLEELAEQLGFKIYKKGIVSNKVLLLALKPSSPKS